MNTEEAYELFLQKRFFYYKGFFTTQNLGLELEKRLERAGFEKCTDNTNVNYTDGVYLQIENNFKIPSSTLVSENSSLTDPGCGFVLELNKPLQEYHKDHALFKFFKELIQPEVYGYGKKPTYSIKEFLNK